MVIREEVKPILEELRDEDVSLKNVNRLWRAAQKRILQRGIELPKGQNVTRNEVEEFLAPAGDNQVYKKIPQIWPGAIKKPVETDSIFEFRGVYPPIA